MLLTKKVLLKWNSRYKTYYIDKGYIFTAIGNEFEISIEDLQKGSEVYINIECDYCHKEYRATYKQFNKYNKSITNKDCCKNCKILKIQETNLVKYGVENYSETEEYHNKCKITSLVNWGTEHPMQNDELKNKAKESSVLKFGVDNYMKTDECKEKIIKTNFEKYKTKSPMQNDSVKEKTKRTNMLKYGVNNPFESEQVKIKIKRYYQDKYGVDNYVQTQEYKDKYKETLFQNYGVYHPMHSEEIRNKIKKTNMERYGVEWSLQNKEIREKITNSFYKNGTCKTSSQQLKIFNHLKDNNYNVELNYPVSRCNLDIALFINNIKINIEYDCWYWHDPKKDRKRDEFLKSQGWKIFRIKSGHKIPSLEQIIEGIFKLVNTDRTFTQIVLDDWKEVKII